MINTNKPSLAGMTQACLKIGLLSFGGPAAQIALMHQVVVEEKRWLDEKQYLSALSFCMLLPGPEAMQLAIYIGWRLHGVLGGLIAGLLFVLPGAFIIFLLSILYIYWGHSPLTEAAFVGVKSAILMVVLDALLRVSKKALLTKAHWFIASLSFISLFFLDLPYPLVVVLAGLFGFFSVQQSASKTTTVIISIMVKQSLKTALIWLAIWLLPLLVLGVLTGWGFLFELGVFFAKLATVTFGGAYAVLAYMSQEVVFDLHWLTTVQMIDGLGLAETTPGPLILVTQFVGFMAGFQENGLGLGVVSALLVLWVTFVPCFLWILVGAPYIEWLAQQPRLQNALAFIVAAVVGVILSLSIWFALHVFFAEISPLNIAYINFWWPNISSINGLVVGLSGVSYYLLLIRRMNIMLVLGVCAFLSMVLTSVV